MGQEFPGSVYAVAGTDFTNPTTGLSHSIPAGSDNVTIPIVIPNDVTVDGNRTILVTVDAPTGAPFTLTQIAASAVIYDNDRWQWKEPAPYTESDGAFNTVEDYNYIWDSGDSSLGITYTQLVTPSSVSVGIVGHFANPGPLTTDVRHVSSNITLEFSEVTLNSVNIIQPNVTGSGASSEVSGILSCKFPYMYTIDNTARRVTIEFDRIGAVVNGTSNYIAPTVGWFGVGATYYTASVGGSISIAPWTIILEQEVIET